MLVCLLGRFFRACLLPRVGVGRGRGNRGYLADDALAAPGPYLAAPAFIPNLEYHA